MATKICVNIVSGNGLWYDGTNRLPESILTYHQWGVLGINLRAISPETPPPLITKTSFKFYFTEISFNSPRGQLVKSLELQGFNFPCLYNRAVSYFVHCVTGELSSATTITCLFTQKYPPQRMIQYMRMNSQTCYDYHSKMFRLYRMQTLTKHVNFIQQFALWCVNNPIKLQWISSILTDLEC